MDPNHSPSFASMSRRRAVQAMGGGLGAIALATAGDVVGTAHGASMIAPHFPPRAKAVIQLFMNGGPFGPDLLDPKPDLTKFAGQRPDSVKLRTERPTAGLMPSPFAFQPRGQSGVPVSELLPRFAECIDDVCVLRSVYTDNPNHGPALYLMNNGTITETRPSMGSWLSYGLGSENESLPRYVVLCPGRPVRFSVLWTSAFLPAEHQGTYINHSSLEPQKLIPYLRGSKTGSRDSKPGLRDSNTGADAQRRLLDLTRSLNELHAAERPGDTALDARIRAMETAFRMQFTAAEAFDLAGETKATREDYGTSHFANGCLLARRLVERGVRFVQVYYGDGQPWDTHTNHNPQVQKLCQDVDRPMAALLTDLKRRGLLDETLVVWGGEFGRTPVSEIAEGGGGRDHNHYGFTMWLAGGGVKGGMTYGETDEFGFRAVQDRVHIHDLHATMLHLLGLDHEKLTYRYAGRDYRLTDVAGKVLSKIVA